MSNFSIKNCVADLSLGETSQTTMASHNSGIIVAYVHILMDNTQILQHGKDAHFIVPLDSRFHDIDQMANFVFYFYVSPIPLVA